MLMPGEEPGFGHQRKFPPADLHVPILGQLPPTDLPLGDALEPGTLEIVGLDAPLRRRSFGQKTLEHPPRNPDHTTVLPNLDAELHRLPLGIPAGVLAVGGWRTDPVALS